MFPQLSGQMVEIAQVYRGDGMDAPVRRVMFRPSYWEGEGRTDHSTVRELVAYIMSDFINAQRPKLVFAIRCSVLSKTDGAEFHNHTLRFFPLSKAQRIDCSWKRSSTLWASAEAVKHLWPSHTLHINKHLATIRHRPLKRLSISLQYCTFGVPRI